MPGDACVALLCAGWLAGRGELNERAGPRAHAALTAPGRSGNGRPRGARERLLILQERFSDEGLGARERLRRFAREMDPLRAAVAAGLVVAALLAAWAEWEPQRSDEASAEALSLAARGRLGAAEAAARTATSRDPLSAEALFTLADVQQIAGRRSAARSTLQRAVRLQPSNPRRGSNSDAMTCRANRVRPSRSCRPRST